MCAFLGHIEHKNILALTASSYAMPTNIAIVQLAYYTYGI